MLCSTTELGWGDLVSDEIAVLRADIPTGFALDNVPLRECDGWLDDRSRLTHVWKLYDRAHPSSVHKILRAEVGRNDFSRAVLDLRQPELEFNWSDGPSRDLVYGARERLSF